MEAHETSNSIARRAKLIEAKRPLPSAVGAVANEDQNSADNVRGLPVRAPQASVPSSESALPVIPSKGRSARTGTAQMGDRDAWP
jgi:hypothetical protein